MMFLWLILISEMLTVIHPTTRTNGLGLSHFSGQNKLQISFQTCLSAKFRTEATGKRALQNTHGLSFNSFRA